MSKEISSLILRCTEEATRRFTFIHRSTTRFGVKNCREPIYRGECSARILLPKVCSTIKAFLSATAFGLARQNLSSLNLGCRVLSLAFVSVVQTSLSAFCTVAGLVFILPFCKRERSPLGIR